MRWGIKSKLGLRWLSSLMLKLVDWWIDPIARDNKLLIIRIQDGVGDFVVSSGSLRAFRQLYPSYHIAVLATERFSDLIQSCPYVDEVILWDVERWQNSHVGKLKFLYSLRMRGFEAVLAPRPARCMAQDLMVQWSGAQSRIGADASFEASSRVESDLPYTRLIRTNNDLNERERLDCFVRSLSGGVKRHCDPELWLKKADELWAIRFIESHQLLPNRWIVVAPGSSSIVIGRRWSVEKYVELLRLLWGEYKIRVVLTGSEDETPLLNHITHLVAIPPMIVAASSMNLRQFAALLKHARLCLGNESGPIHMAMAMGIPTVCILGGGHFRKYCPYGHDPIHKVVYHEMDCFGCDWKCIYSSVRCIEHIGVHKVWATLRDNLLLSEQSREFAS